MQKEVWYYEKWVGRHASFPPRRDDLLKTSVREVKKRWTDDENVSFILDIIGHNLHHSFQHR